MYRLTNLPTTRKVTIEEIKKKFLPCNNFPGQRELNPLKVHRYSLKMDRGEMRPVDIAIATLPSGIKVLMNGQHACHAIVMHGKPHLATISYYTCETDEDAWKLFATFDGHAARTDGQIIKAARGLFTDERLHDLPLRVLTTAGSAFIMIGAGGKPRFELTGIEKTDRADAVQNNADEVIWLASWKDHKHLFRIGVFAAMINTHRKDASIAQSFWQTVADGIGVVTKDSPPYRLREWLRNFSKSPCGRARDMHFIVYSTCISWWNSYVTGQKRNSVKVGAMQEPPDVAAPTVREAVTTEKILQPNGKARLRDLVATARA